MAKIYNILLVVVFGLILCVPVLRINRDATSVTENRTLATMPHLMVDGRINNKFGEEFNAWFNDRFFGRATLIRIHNELIAGLQTGDTAVTNHPTVLIGRDNWLFFKGENSLQNYTNSRTPDTHAMSDGLQYLVDIDNWCRQHNKRFYYVIAPDKNKIYPEFFPSDIRKVRPDSFGMGMTFYKYIRDNSNVNVIYPYDALMRAKDDGEYLYYTNDTHWNMLGAYIAFRILYAKIYNRDFDAGRFIRAWGAERHSGDLVKMLDLRDSSQYVQELFKQPKFFNEIKCTHTKKYSSSNGLIECKNPNGRLRAYVFRDSFSGALVPYMSQVFSVADFHWKYRIDKSDLDAIKDNYDVIILENVERYIPTIVKEKFPKD